jgi:hemolysin activation/secretion protein
VTAGDSTLIATLEYRFHLPRTFSIQPDPSTLFGRPFRAAPDRPFGLPDWDLVLKAFIDVGRSVNSDRQPGESDDTLVGTGVGAELVLWQNLSVRVDWGIALEDVPGEVSSGSNRVNFVVTIQF